jgi:hypothetical protein
VAPYCGFHGSVFHVPRYSVSINGGTIPSGGQPAIHERAYAFWEQEDRPDGRDVEHWLRAEAEIHRASAGQITIDDNELCDLYRLLQEARRSLGDLYPAIRHDDGFLDRCRYDGPAAMLVVLMAREHILTATNTMNRFSYDILSLTAWNKVFASATEAERMQALYEFLSPTASHCLSMPYAIKQMFIKSICQISHQTNRFNDNNWDERALPRMPKFSDAGKLESRFNSWCCVRHFPCSTIGRSETLRTTTAMNSGLNSDTRP